MRSDLNGSLPAAFTAQTPTSAATPGAAQAAGADMAALPFMAVLGERMQVGHDAAALRELMALLVADDAALAPEAEAQAPTGAEPSALSPEGSPWLLAGALLAATAGPPGDGKTGAAASVISRSAPPGARQTQGEKPEKGGKDVLALAATSAAASAKIADGGRILPAMSAERTARVEPLPTIDLTMPTRGDNATAALQGAISAGAQSVAPQGALTVNDATLRGLAAPVPQALRAPETPTQVAVDAEVQSPRFAGDLGGQIVWLASRQTQVAEISLNPPNLGPLEVRLSLSDAGSGVQFFSPHAQVREAVEAALPRLRELMADAGIQLGDAQVRDQALARQGQGGQGQDAASRQSGGPSSEAQSAETHGGVIALSSGPARAGLGLVDLYV